MMDFGCLYITWLFAHLSHVSKVIIEIFGCKKAWAYHCTKFFSFLFASQHLRWSIQFVNQVILNSVEFVKHKARSYTFRWFDNFQNIHSPNDDFTLMWFVCSFWICLLFGMTFWEWQIKIQRKQTTNQSNSSNCIVIVVSRSRSRGSETQKHASFRKIDH